MRLRNLQPVLALGMYATLVASILLSPIQAMAISATTRNLIENDAQFFSEKAPCTTSVAALPTNLTGNDNEEKVFNFFVAPEPTGLGLTPAQAAGAVGNLMEESGGKMDPNSHQGGGGPGRGIAQWTVTERWLGVLALAKSTGRSEWDLAVQLDYMKQELTSGYKDTYAKLKTAPDVASAELIFEQGYERPRKGKELRDVRMKYANEALALYGNGATTTTATSGTPATTTVTTATPQTEDQKIAQTFIVGFNASTTPAAEIKAAVQKYHLGGIFVLGNKDAATKTFTKSFMDELNTAAGIPLVASSDEEGVFTRFNYPQGSFPDALTMASKTDAEVEAIGKQVGQAMQANGFNTDLAPVLDVAYDTNGTDAATARRAFSNNPAVVTAKAGAFAKGLKSAGVTPVYKHFPGIGSITSGSTDNSILSTVPLASLKAKDLKPFEALIGQNGGAVMLNNAKTPGLTKGNDVAGISKEAVNLLRNDYKFGGLITTDDLAAKSMTQGAPAMVTKALQAGVDMPLFAYTSDKGLQDVINSVKASKVSVTGALNHVATFKSSLSTTTTTPAANVAAAGCCKDSVSSSSTSTTATATGKVYMIGDSITEGTKNQLTTSLNAAGYTSVDINGVSNRKLTEGSGALAGLSILAADKSRWSNANTIIIELGTNSGLTKDNITKAMAILKGTTAKVYWVNIGANNALRAKNKQTALDADKWNTELSSNSSLGYTIIDWASVVKAHGDYIDPTAGGLGVHPFTDAGRPAFAKTVADGAAGGGTTPTTSASCDTTSSTATGQASKFIDGFKIYNQMDPAWKNTKYGTSTIGEAGCGPSALAMVITALTGQSVEPPAVAAYAADNGIYHPGAGSAHTISPVAAEHWNLKAQQLTTNVASISQALAKGALVVAPGQGAKPFTGGGHFIVIRAITASGKWKVGDSGHSDTSDKEWDPQTLVSDMRKGGVYAITK